MKVLLAVHHFPPTYSAGSEWLAFRFANGLQARGHEVRVVCVERIDRGPPGRVEWEDDTFRGLAVRRLSFDLSASPDPFRWEYDNPWVGAHLDELFTAFEPDVFQLVGGYLLTGRALQVARQRGIFTAVRLCDFWFLCPRLTLWRSDAELSSAPLDSARCVRCRAEEQRRWRLPGRLTPRLMSAYWRSRRALVERFEARRRYLLDELNGAGVIVSPSQFTREMHIRAGVEARRIVVVEKGCDIPVQVCSGGRPAARPRVGYVGQIVPHKGVELLPLALRRLPNADLEVRVYGDCARFPDYAANVQRLAAGDRRIVFAGPFAAHERDRVFAELDAVVVPSLWYENSPNAIFEAFAHRTPVVAADLGSMRELVRHDGNGLLFAPANAASLAAQLGRLVAEPPLLGRLRAGIGPVRPAEQEVADLEALYLDRLPRNAERGGRSQQPA